MPINFNLKKYMNDIFIETGTYIGEGVQKALDSGFSQIYSIEIDPDRYNKCKEKFKDFDNVEILLGDSGKVLPDLLNKINKRATFWIDAHYCADGAVIGDKWCPMKEEFDAIKNSKIKNHTILVDDWRCMDNVHTDITWKKQLHNKDNIKNNQNIQEKEVGFLGKSTCYNILKNINEKYIFSFEDGCEKDDVLVCKTDE